MKKKILIGWGIVGLINSVAAATDDPYTLTNFGNSSIQVGGGWILDMASSFWFILFGLILIFAGLKVGRLLVGRLGL